MDQANEQITAPEGQPVQTTNAQVQTTNAQVQGTNTQVQNPNAQVQGANTQVQDAILLTLEQLEEFNKYRPFVIKWMEILHVPDYSFGLVYTKRAGWHMLITVGDEDYETVIIHIGGLPKTAFNMRIACDVPVKETQP